MATLPSVAKAEHPAIAAGVAKAVKVVRWECRCVKCGHRWLSNSDEVPDHCNGCRKDTWWLKRPVGRPRLVKEP